MQKTLKCLEIISHLAKGSADAAQVRKAIESARAAVQEERSANSALFAQLDSELSVWLTKLDVLLNEPAGRHGMAKHAIYWLEQIKNVK